MSVDGLVLVLGGTSGIGLATARRLEINGVKVVVAGRNPSRVAGIEAIPCDVLSELSVKSCIESVGSTGQFSGLVYSVGITVPKKSVEEFEEKIWLDVLNTNVTGLLFSLKYAFPYLLRAKGSVVVVNSLSGRTFSKSSGVEYTASKAALGGVVRQLAMEWIRKGVRINSVYPGPVDSPMLRSNLSATSIKDLESSIPLGSLASAEEIAKTITFLLDHQNAHLTGVGIDVSGGDVLTG